MDDYPVEPEEMDRARAERAARRTDEEHASFERGVKGTFSAQEDLNMDRSGALLVKAGRDLAISNSAALAIVAGGDVGCTNGIAQAMVVGGNFNLTNGGAEVMVVGGNATLKKSFILAVIAKQVSLEEGSRVLLNMPQAIAFGAAMGAVAGLLSWMLPSRKGR